MSLVNMVLFQSKSMLFHLRTCLQTSTSFTSVIRGFSAVSKAFEVSYNEYGDPNKVLEGKTKVLYAPQNKDVLVKMLMAPVNPADINMIEGTYHIKPPLPAVSGNEGVGEVLAVGTDVGNLNIGDWVIPSRPGLGTWRTHGIFKDTELQPIRNDIPIVSAATVAVNPCTAYRMLQDFVKLQPGDTVIQNGANSAVGQAVIQLAKEWNLQTINIVRERPDIQNIIDTLEHLGASHVVTEEFSRKPEMKELLKSLPSPPKLALNCVGGKSATELLRHIGHRGIMVTYGGMSKKPIAVPTGALIFKEVKLFGYWNSNWNEENKDNPEKDKMFKYLCGMIHESKLLPPVSDLIHITKFKEVVKSAMEGYKGTKKLFVME